MLIKIIILAAIIERIWEHAQQVIGDKHLTRQAKLLGSAVFSITAAVTLKLDLLFALQVTGAESLPGVILTGFAIGLGTNVIHDLVDTVNNFSTKTNPGGGEW